MRLHNLFLSFSVVCLLFLSNISSSRIANQKGMDSYKKVSDLLIPVRDSFEKTHLHIFGIGPRTSAWKYKFTINGTELTLKPSHCMDFFVTGDSVYIKIRNKPLIKSQSPVNLVVPAKQDLYVYLNSGEPMEKFPYTTMAVKEICKECYDSLSKKCK